MKVLVIGANGFLGRYVVEGCFKKNWQVSCCYHVNKNHIPESCPLIHVNDLSAYPHEFDTVFLLASYIPYSGKDEPDNRLIEINVNLPLTVSKTFRRSKIIFASSVAVYGAHDNEITENTGFNGPSLYGLSKLSGEFIIQHHPRYSILRFSSLYGKGMTSATFLPAIIRNAREKRTISLFGDGSRRQDYLHVRDAANYCINAALYGNNETYLGVNGRSFSNLNVAKMIQKELTGGCEIHLDGSDNSSSFIYNCNYSKSMLQYTPQISLKQGIRELL